ncbi:uncharacterized protein LOC130449927 isoform X2 [Diorhabda sublineata]|uniref:uncharacterized protein LOC130449927 isoform X2 n=1 Tax=Diorhabda sublineata TaxID=1163346 RepID=UPI0024E057F4|nr:uncharacterized protein LOC130449927 isoform X2 [Diorhabda sublineata]
MKVKTWLLLTITVSYVIITTKAIRTPIYAPFNIISLKDITPEERRQIAYLEQKLQRAKRSGSSGSGSGEILNLLKTAIGNGIKKKVGQLAMASAAASGAFSKTSSGGGYHTGYHHHHHHPPDYSYEEHHDHHDHSHKSFDFWNLKKSILNTLLQAVKAVKGGVIAVKGQLVKGGGKLISASGHLVSSQGDAITHLGKKIATSAILVPWMGSSGKGHPHVEYESGDHHYSAPSAPSDIYHHSSPSGPSSDYHIPEHYPPPHREGTSGLLILKKVPGHGRDRHEYYSSSVDTHHDQSPSFGSVLGKLFSASSSLDPHKPELYGDNPVEHHVDSYQADIVESDHNEIVPSASDIDKTSTIPPDTVTKHNSGSNKPDFKKNPFDSKEIVGVNQNSKPEEVNTNNYVSQSEIGSFQYTGVEDLQEFNNPTNIYLSPPPISQIISKETDIENNSLIDIKNSQLIENSIPSPFLETPKIPTVNDPTVYNEFTHTFDFTQSDIKNLNNFESSYNQFYPNFDVVPSISYELQPQGPKRLT